MAPMAESMPACTVDSTGSIVAVRRAWRDVGQLFERALVVFAFVAAAAFAFCALGPTLRCLSPRLAGCMAAVRTRARRLRLRCGGVVRLRCHRTPVRSCLH